jgi:hypothetical protein
MSEASPLGRALTSLDHTGPGGFEGLVRLLLEAWTGRKFVLARSGSQHGHDIAGTTTSRNVIAVECKRYGQASRLSARGLAGELVEATREFPTLEVWVLVTPKEVASQEAALLKRTGDENAIETLILDDRAQSLGDLPVFCAAYPEVTIRFLLKHSKDASREVLTEHLEGIRQDPEFSAVAARLSRSLRSSDGGFDNMRRRCRQWFHDAVKTKNQSLARFKQDVAILDDSRALPLPRKHISEAMDRWWHSEVIKRPIFALFGAEGSGKTWAALQWSHPISELDNAPLVVPIAAVDVPADANDIGSLLADVLAKRCKRQTESMDRKFRRWLIGPVEPRFLIILDGLNERSSNQWASILATTAQPEWSGRIGVIVTSWTGYWQRELSTHIGHMSRELETTGYTDDELDRILESRRLRVGEIRQEVVQLLRRPRYCDLALKKLPELNESRDFTVERLLYEDHKDRIGRKLNTPLSHEAFCELLCQLAGRHKEGHVAFSSQEIRAAAAPHEEAFQFIIGGGLLRDTGKASRRFEVQHDWLVLGLGILLAEHASEIEAEILEPYLDAVDQWLEPHAEMALKAEICGAAAYVSLKRQYPSLARQALLIRWIGAHNPGSDLEHKTGAYLCEFLPDFIAVAEEFWKAAVDNRLAQDRIAWAFAERFQQVSQREEFKTAITRWLSLINRTGQPSDRRREDGDGRELAAKIAERVGTVLVPAAQISYAGYEFDVVDDDGLLRLARFGLYLLSGTVSHDFGEAFVRWALSRRIMGSAYEYEEVAWVLRLSGGGVWPSIEPILIRFAESADPVRRKAAHTLLGCLGTRDAQDLREEKLSDLSVPHELARQHQDDPCTSAYSWTRDDCVRCLDREDVPIQKFVWDISRHAIDPSLEVSVFAIGRFEEYVRNLPTDRWHSSLYRSDVDLDIEEGEAALAAYVPQTFVSYLRRDIQRIGKRDDEGRRQLLICLSDASQIVDAAARQSIETVLQRYWEGMGGHDSVREEGIPKRERFAEAEGTLAIIMHMGADAAVDYLLARPIDAQDLLVFGRWITPVSEDKRDELLALMESEVDDDKLARILWMLSWNEPDLQPSQETRLLRLLESGNKVVRALAFELAVASANRACFEQIVSRKSVFQYPKDSREADWCAWVLANHGQSLSVSELASRMPLGHLSDALQVRGMKPAEVEEYAALVHELWRDVWRIPVDGATELPALIAEKEEQHGTTVIWLSEPAESCGVTFRSASSSWRGRRSGGSADLLRQHAQNDSDDVIAERQRRFWETVETLRARKENVWWASVFNAETLAEIGRLCPSLVQEWISAGLKGTPDSVRLLGRCSGFYQSLCVGLTSSMPDLAFQLWEAIRNRPRSVRFIDANTGTDWISGMPFSVSDSEHCERARRAVLDECFSDRALLELTGAALGMSQEVWILSQAQRLIRSENLSERAKGIALCCLADFDDETVKKLIVDADIGGTWVAEVLDKLEAYHNRNEWARHWYGNFLRAEAQDESWCAFRLFLKCVDRRWQTWVAEMEQDSGLENVTTKWRIRFRKTLHQAIRRAIERNEKALTEVYLSVKFHRGELIPFA